VVDARVICTSRCTARLIGMLSERVSAEPRGWRAHPEKVCNIEEASADTNAYILVYAIDEPRHQGWHRDYHCGGGAPVLGTS
jgi:hypothetical protein